MDLNLNFAGGKIEGDGNDAVGRFVIHGYYDSKTLECHWTKSYVGAHDVIYSSFREGKGIWGKWEIPGDNIGGFHIWPLGEGTDEGEAGAKEQEQPVEAVGELVVAGHH